MAFAVPMVVVIMGFPSRISIPNNTLTIDGRQEESFKKASVVHRLHRFSQIAGGGIIWVDGLLPFVLHAGCLQ